MTEYDAVIFDNDGVLVEPPAYDTQSEATRTAFEAVGVADADRTHLDAVVGGVTVDGLYELCTAYDLDPESFWAAREHHDEQSQLEKFRAGARTCYDDVSALSGLSDLTSSCGLVSNNHHSTIEFVLEFFELHSLFDTYYGRPKTIESLRLKKPNPHYLDKALADLGAESALYVGDSESDVVAAHRADMDSVFVRRAHCRDVSLSTDPTYEVKTLHDVAALLDE
ncbi:haloacid dehalogenase superfamily, subfamily IA, variant 1 with third motif having Dx(3-4)D or Dx(3-4)E [Haladaptatus litoreus]|uniref:Haloacid dehalogenase superfamily, subfamily IA, variant 1 with third motif having Dx(3-4)D or Dx(3-4)E n=1 Tax=Haladaptatus litoreus TaxID=553468 RepID=A0A1N6UXJ9_9EURY|nr:HAD family hydrolase [Haladaptatus litoreus]SIQ70291.1 haloacid dehalogenase superfamily, subfamily IA, variant 1 with third motif having Dx(3-4)D or Dx(3-4)E [Haladaptatus litoreus]